MTAPEVKGEPSWLIEGGRCIAYNYSTVERHTIERLTKTLVILESGARFNRAALRRRVPGAWASDWTLHAPDDPSMLSILAAHRRRTFVGRVLTPIEKCMRAWRDDPSDISHAEKAIELLKAAIADVAQAEVQS